MCDLRLVPGTWDFAEVNAAAIDAHWERRRAEAPAFFNGRIHVMTSCVRDGATFAGRFIAVDFKPFLYWHETGEADRSVYDAFGSGVLWSADGAVLLGRQRAGNINAGLTYPPGGFIDARDVDPDGRIDVAGSVRRELAEETGVDPAGLRQLPGHVVTCAGQQVSIATQFVSPLSAVELVSSIGSHLAADSDGELEAIVAMRTPADLEDVAMPAFTRHLMGFLFASAPGRP